MKMTEETTEQKEQPQLKTMVAKFKVSTESKSGEKNGKKWTVYECFFDRMKDGKVDNLKINCFGNTTGFADLIKGNEYVITYSLKPFGTEGKTTRQVKSFTPKDAQQTLNQSTKQVKEEVVKYSTEDVFEKYCQKRKEKDMNVSEFIGLYMRLNKMKDVETIEAYFNTRYDKDLGTLIK
jgi:phage gp16-like protein